MSGETSPEGRLRTVLTVISDNLKRELPDLDEVEFVFITPDAETKGKVLYLEIMPFDFTVDSLGSTQRTANFQIDMIGLIRSDDPLVGVDFLWETLQALVTPTTVEHCTNAFGTTDGFSIESITGCDSIPSSPNQRTGTGEYNQIRAKISISMGGDL